MLLSHRHNSVYDSIKNGEWKYTSCCMLAGENNKHATMQMVVIYATMQMVVIYIFLNNVSPSLVCVKYHLIR